MGVRLFLSRVSFCCGCGGFGYESVDIHKVDTTRTDRLVTGASDQSDTESRSSFTRVIVPASVTETVIGAFGTVAGQRKPAVFVVPGTTVKLSLKGGGSGQVVRLDIRWRQGRAVVARL